MQFPEKINKIFDLLINKSKDNPFPQATYWKMGTSLSTMIDRFYKKIKNIEDLSLPMICKHEEQYSTIQGNNKVFNLYIGDKQVTPIMSYKKGASLAAITQYRRTLCAFNLLFIKDKIVKERDFVLKGIKGWLSPNSKELLKKEKRIQLITKLISDSFFTNHCYCRNFSYSIIIEFLIHKNFDFSILTKSNRLLHFKKACGPLNNKNFKVLDLYEDLEEIKKDIKRQGTLGTYKEITKILNDKFQNVESFIDYIHQEYLYKHNSDEYQKIYLTEKERINVMSSISIERQKFKNNIFKDRKELHLIFEENDLYTDLSLIDDNSQEGLLTKFKEGEAAHIWDVQSIKNKIYANISNNFENKELKQNISNPKNGIIMRGDYHSSFDRNQWTFDLNGNMIYNQENENYLFNVLKLKKIKIRPEIFNEQTKKFIEMRNVFRENTN